MSASAPDDGIWIRVRHVAPAQEDGIRIDIFNHGGRSGVPTHEGSVRQQYWEEGSGHRRVSPTILAAQEFGSYWEAVSRSQELLRRSAALLVSPHASTAAPRSKEGPAPSFIHSPSSTSRSPSRPSNSRPSRRPATQRLDAVQAIRRAYVHSYRGRARAAAAMAAASLVDPPTPRRLPQWRPPGTASLPTTPQPPAPVSSPAPPAAEAQPHALHTPHPALHTPKQPPLLGRLHLGVLPAGLPVRMGAATARAGWTSVRVRRLLRASKRQSPGRALAQTPAASPASSLTLQPAPADLVGTPAYMPGKARGRQPLEAVSSTRLGSGATTPAYAPVHRPAASGGWFEDTGRGRPGGQGDQEAAGARQEGRPGPKKEVRRRLLKDLKSVAEERQPQAVARTPGTVQEEVRGGRRATAEQLRRSGPAAGGVPGARGAAAAGPVPAVGQRGRQVGVQAAAGPRYSSPTASSLQMVAQAPDKQRRARTASKPGPKSQPRQTGAAGRPAAALRPVLQRDALPESTQRLREHIRLLRARARAAAAQGQVVAEQVGGGAGQSSAPVAPAPLQQDARRSSQQLAMVGTLAAATAFGMAAAALRSPSPVAPNSAAQPSASAPLSLSAKQTTLSQSPWGNVGVSGLPKLRKREPGQPLSLNPLPLAASPLMHVSVSGNMVVDVSATLELTVPLQVEVDFEVSPPLLAELHAAAQQAMA